MYNTRASSISEIKHFITSTKALAFKAKNKTEAYQWKEGVLQNTLYKMLSKKDKSTIRRYLGKVTSYSVSHVDRLVRKYVATVHLVFTVYKRNSFHRKYADKDIALLARVDETHNNLSGPATATILQEEWMRFKRVEFKNIANISTSHIYNLRETRLYHETNHHFQKTHLTQVR